MKIKTTYQNVWDVGAWECSSAKALGSILNTTRKKSGENGWDAVKTILKTKFIANTRS
jgi:hypothetical protein